MSHWATQLRPDSRPSSLIWGSCIQNRVKPWSHTCNARTHPHTRKAIVKKETFFFSPKGHSARTSVKGAWRSSMHRTKGRITEKNRGGEERDECDKSTQDFKETEKQKKQKKQKSLTYSFRLRFDHFHERSSRRCLHHFFFCHLPGVQKLQLGQLVQNKVPVRKKKKKTNNNNNSALLYRCHERSPLRPVVDKETSSESEEVCKPSYTNQTDTHSNM